MSFVGTIEEHIKEYETAIANSLANHNGLLGGLASLQRALAAVKPLVEEVSPAGEHVLEVVDAVITDIEG